MRRHGGHVLWGKEWSPLRRPEYAPEQRTTRNAAADRHAREEVAFPQTRRVKIQLFGRQF